MTPDPEPDGKLVEMILRDRSPYGWTRKEAETSAARYLHWLEDLKSTPVLSDSGERTLHYVLDQKLLRPGRGAALYAAQGKGKTNVLAVLTQLTVRYRRDWVTFTNVPYPWWSGAGPSPPRVHLAESLSELLRALSERTLQGKWSAVLIDEFDQVDTSHTWASETSESWARYLFVARHYMTRGPVVVFHGFPYIPKAIRGGSVGSPFKLVTRKGERVIVDLENPYGDYVGTWPESELPYLTFGLRGFRIDVDVQELESRFVGPRFAGDVTAVARTTLDYLAQLRTLRTPAEDRRSGAEVDALIADDIRKGASYQEIRQKWKVGPTRIARLRARVLADSRSQIPSTGELATRARTTREAPPAGGVDP